MTIPLLMVLSMAAGGAQITPDILSQATSGLNISPLGDIALEKLQQNLSQTGKGVIQNVSESNAKILQNASETGHSVISNLGLNQESMETRAKEELKRQAQEKVQQPGFEAALASAGILGALFIMRRRC